MREALSRECARAGRYDRHLGFVLLRLDAPLTNEVLATAERISALRFGLQICLAISERDRSE